jgi:hypothetical protein
MNKLEINTTAQIDREDYALCNEEIIPLKDYLKNRKKRWVSVESELACLKELLEILRKKMKVGDGLGWIEARLRTHIEELQK